MTAQVPDVLLLDDASWHLLATPLDRRLDELGVDFVAQHTGSRRGYVARWEVRDGRLWLLGVRGTVRVTRVLEGLSGLVSFPPGQRSASLADCRGLVIAADDGPALPVPASHRVGRWFIAKNGRSAIWVTDDSLAAALAEHREGMLFCGHLDVKLAKARIVNADRVASATDLDGLTAEIGPDAEPTHESWVWRQGEIGHGFSSYAEERVPGITWVRTAPPPWLDSWGPAPDPGPPSWPVERLVVRSMTVAEQDLTALGTDPLPLAADFVTGRFRAGRGEVIEYVHSGFESSWANEIMLDVHEGRVTNVTRVRGVAPTYVLRAFLDPGSGQLLWSGNAAANERWDYPVDPAELPIEPDLVRQIEALVADYDDHNPDVGGTLQDTPQWRFAFQTRYRAVLAALRSQLGSDVEIRDEGRLPT